MGGQPSWPRVVRSGCAVAALLAAGAEARYTSCTPGRFGSECEGRCSCAPVEDCDDGISGDGRCTCALGYEAECDPSTVVGPRPHFAGTAAEVRGLGPVSALVFTNLTLSALRVDPETRRHTRQVRNASLSRVLPGRWRTTRPRLGLLNPKVAERLGIDPAAAALDEDATADMLSGARLPANSQPFAHAYGGHQFGSWAGQLGDGRALSLGEALGFPPALDAAARREQVRDWPWEVTLKGAGKTPYSRGGDGRAALANAAREFFAPIYLEASGVPVAGTLSVVASDAKEDMIVRDEWYDGNVAPRKPGIVARVAPTFLRFGSVKLAARRQGVDGLAQVVRFALAALARVEAHDDGSTAYFDRATAASTAPPAPGMRERCFFGRRVEPSCVAGHATHDHQGLFQCLLQRATERTAALVAAWMALGFAHGVMNTDNLSVLGITIDLNVYGFLAEYDPSWAPNHIDEEARYAFGAQPDIARWNLQRLADALTGTRFEADHEDDASTWMLADKGRWLSRKAAEKVLKDFTKHYRTCHEARMELRLGLPATGVGRPCLGEASSGSCLVERWLEWLERSGADYPRASRGLAEVGDGPVGEEATLLAEHAGARRRGAEVDRLLAEFLALHREAVRAQPGDWRAAVRAAVPALAPRSHILREAAKALELEGSGGAALLEGLQRALGEPFSDLPEVPLGRAEDDPQEAWRGVKLTASGIEGGRAAAAELEASLRRRLGALPPAGLRQIRTSCGAQ